MNKRQKYRFAFIITGFALVLLFIYREDVLGNILAPMTFTTARATLLLLHLCGIEAARTATVIYHPNGFAYEIYYRCVGFLPVALLTISIFAYPGRSRFKFPGLALGLPLLLSLNLLRLVCLFYIGVYFPSAFGFAHAVIWDSLMMLATFGLWLVWIKWKEEKLHERSYQETGSFK